jgi:hypothetical protein
MRGDVRRVLLVLFLFTFGFGFLHASPAAAADKTDKKKAWAAKKHHKTHHKSGKPKAVGAAAGAAPSGGAAPAEADDEEEGGETAEAGDQQDDAKAKPKAKPASSDSSDEREASDEKAGGDDDDDDNNTGVVRRKAKRPTMEEGGAPPIAFELEAGPRAIHRSFDFNSPAAGMTPFRYALPAGPAPFVDLGIYPAAFATRGFAANLGLIANYERLIGAKTEGSNQTTGGQQLEFGVRGRVPVGENELGLAVSYGKHTFHVTDNDPGPAMGTVPNVDYTFAGIGVDGRLRLSPIEIGAHVGTRLVFSTGSLGDEWFRTVKTGSIAAGVSIAYRLSTVFDVVGGVDLMRYAFDFNPVVPTNPLIVGGAVDQYISGYVALRVSLSGS